MWRLKTLGGLAIQADGSALEQPATDIVAQRRPLALLAVLAVAGERGISRDELLVYFWPDSNVERARNALRQTTFRLRRDLGVAHAVLGTTILRLNPDVVTSDLAEFESSIAIGDLDRAVALYSGPFLQGISIGDAPEFDEWSATQRTRLAQRLAAAIESLASAAEARADYETAIGWWRRLATIDPSSSRAAVGLMTSLAAAGDRQGALQYYRLHELLIQEELGLAAEDTVESLVNHLPNAAVAAEASSEENAPHVEHILDLAPASSISSETSNARSRSTLSSAVAKWRVTLLPSAIVAALMLAFVINRNLPVPGGRVAAAAPAASNTIAVFPFVTRSNTVDAQLGDAVTDLLSVALSGTARLRVVDRRSIRQASAGSGAALQDPSVARAIAAPHHADELVLGEVAIEGDRLTVTATLYSLPAGASPMPVAELGETGPRADIAHVVDGLARRILAELHPDSSDRLLRSAALSARSLAALKSFISGEYYFRAGDYASALAAFQQAVREDTAFALAHYRLSVVGDWASHPTLPDEGLENAVRFATGLPAYDQHLISALAAWRHGQAAEAMQLYRRAVSEFPGDVEAWYQLGEVIFHAGPVLGHSVAEARPAFERALKFRAGARESLVHLVRIASKLRDYRAVDSLTRLALAADSVRDATEMRLFRAIAIGDVQGRRDLVDSLRASPDEAVLTAAWRVGTFAEDFSTASDISRLLIDPSRGELYQGYGRWYVASLDLAAGRWRAARAALAPTMSQRVVASDSSEGQRVRGPASLDAVHIGHLGMMAALPVLALRENEVTEIERGLAAWADAPAGMQDWSNMFSPDLKDLIMGLLRARRGDTVAALGHAERLERVRGPHGLTRFAAASALTLRAEVARAGGQREEALALLERAPIFASLSAVVPSRAYERFLRAELLRDLGRDDEALRWYATQGQSTIPDLIYLAPAHLRQAEIHERRGDRAEAVADYRRFVELWSECDPELRPLVEDARRHLARLGTP